MPHKAKTNVLLAAQTLADAKSDRDTALDTILGDFDTDYDALDPDDPAFATDVAALIASRDSDIKAALLSFDLTFCGDAPSKIFGENPDRQGLTVTNDCDKKLSLYIDSETVDVLEAAITTRNTDLLALLATFDAAVAALDPDDGDYATDLAALRTTRDSDVDAVTDDYDTARAAADDDLVEYTYASANGGRYDFPGVNWFDGPVWGAFAADPTGSAAATETRRR